MTHIIGLFKQGVRGHVDFQTEVEHAVCNNNVINDVSPLEVLTKLPQH